MKKKCTWNNVVKMTGLSAVFLFSSILVQGQVTLLDAKTHPKFVNPLPQPAQIDITAGGDFEMEMNQTTQWLGLVDPMTNQPLMTTVWGYGLNNGTVTYPGPTFIAKKDVPVNITWHNKLPGKHILPVDYSLHMAHPHGVDARTFYEAGNIPTVVHLHGGHTESASDGLPEAWYTQGFAHTGNFFVKEKYTFHNDQEAATLWYHDHGLGITRLNVYAGLAGFYLLEDLNERSLVNSGVLPKGKHDVELVFQDRMFTPDGELFLPSNSGDPWFGDLEGEDLELPFDSSVVAEFFGDFILVNGVAWPAMSVEPRPYRYRLLNGSDSRTYRFQIGDANNPISFLQIATDNGLLETPVALTELILAPGERAEIVIDFAGHENENITVFNYGPDGPFKGVAANQDPADPLTTGLIMQFNVNQRLKVNRGLPIPSVNENSFLRPAIKPLYDPTLQYNTRKLALFEGMDSEGRLQPLLGVINGDMPKSDVKLNGSLAWFEDITEKPMLNDTEIWEVYNNTEDAHPIHLHLVSFQILDRQPFEADVFEQDQIEHHGNSGVAGYVVESSINLTGPTEAPAANEKGWKDTFVVPPGYVGRVIAKFDRPGRYVWHCHILSHEDHEMMRPYEVIAPALKNGSITPFADKSPSEQNSMEAFSFYPNPAKEFVNLTFTQEDKGYVSARIYNVAGELMKSVNLGEMPSGQSNASFSVRDLHSGMYLLEIKTSSRTYKNQFVISK